ncbi:expressed unknown protein [Seminavis robusta]|uniref:Uncharacterized protein n=1 Tax=Seminavis robusta TaxID=568900 RepID=A0A9N8HT86_9STRA|nr:expressed unknown protein [Seminavis robusta]|eukprot:Sro1628_g287010.1 n/a (190) ;mRNA; r:16750-17319
MISSNTISVLFFALAALSTSVQGNGNSKLGYECWQEIRALNQNQELEDAFDDLLVDDLEDDYDESCKDKKVWDIGCYMDFKKHHEAFDVACDKAGGKIYDQNVGLNCSYTKLLKFDMDIPLGKIPICLGQSCNVTEFVASDLDKNRRVQDFLEELSFDNCEGTLESGAISTIMGGALLATIASVGVLML